MKLKQKHIDAHAKRYELERAKEEGAVMYINRRMAREQQEAYDRGLRHGTLRWAYNTFKIYKVIEGDLGIKMKVDWKGEFKSFGISNGIQSYFMWLLAQIT